MSFQKYPISHQDFKKLIEGDFIYVDKTKHIYNMVKKGGYYFLSRPRRFGKSLIVSTLDYLFKGKKELFKGLYIEDKWDFVEYPVIRLSFSDIGYRTSDLTFGINERLGEISKIYQFKLNQTGVDVKFRELIIALHDKYQKQVVVLIDEYDKPIIDYLDEENRHKAHENRAIMKSFYSILKDADKYLKLVFITGVSKFSQVSIFSDLNNLFDLTMSPSYNTICGITQKELEDNFVEEMKVYDAQKMKEWYNGYRWDVEGETMYNPFSILKFFADEGRYFNHWFNTGTPSFLIELSKKYRFYDVEDVQANSFLLSSFDIDNLEPIPVMFQTGYLTITGYDPLFDRFILNYPNHEVKSAYLQYLTKAFLHSNIETAMNIPSEMLTALKTQKPENLEKAINEAFSHIPYPLWEREHEKFYHAIIHLLFSLLGVYIQSEVHTKDGRADAIILYEDHVYCLEFKLNKTAEEAVAQVKEKNYLESYSKKAKNHHIIGINFDSSTKKVEKIIWEEV